MANRINDIILCMQKVNNGYSGYEIFCDWVKAFAISISNSFDTDYRRYEDRERQYMELIKKHGNDTMHKFSEMSAMLIETMDDEITDVLGKIYMESGIGSKEVGQFFTPFHISLMSAKIIPYEGGIIRLNEPSCGAGGMIIAKAKALQEQGINYQDVMRVVAQDLDYKAVYMTYIQLSILGIRATVIRCNALNGDKIKSSSIWRTPFWWLHGGR